MNTNDTYNSLEDSSSVDDTYNWESVRWVALSMALGSLVLQLVIMLSFELWRRRFKETHNGYYNTHWTILVANVVCILSLCAYYSYRVWVPPTVDSASLLYGEMALGCGIALIIQCFQFPSIRDVSGNLSGICHMFVCFHIYVRDLDYWGLGAGLVAVFLAGIRPPRAFRYKTE